MTIDISRLCSVEMQSNVVKLSEEFYSSFRRHSYVTPTSYLGVLHTFQNLFENKRSQIGGMKDRYENGVTKLNETSEQVR